MKTFLRPLIFIALVFAGLQGYAQCPVPNFNYSIAPGGQVTFQNASTNNNDSLVQGNVFDWNFGDGDTAINNNSSVTHTYAANGWYLVTLTALNANLGCSQDSFLWIEVNRCHPAAQFNTYADGLGTYDFVADHQQTLSGLFTYAWNFGDGSSSSTPDSVVHSYTSSGNYTVTLYATSSVLGCVDTSAVNLNVVSCTFPLSIDTAILSHNPVDIQFSSSAQNVAYTYAWGFSNGGSGTGASVSQSFLNPGYYEASLSVTDASTGCAATASLNFVVSNTCGLVAQNFTYSINNGGQVLFSDASYSSDTIVNDLTYIWIFGDGDTSTNSGNQANHSYAAGGTYNVSLEILNASQGCDTIFYQTLEVNMCHTLAQFSTTPLGSGSYDFVPFYPYASFTYAWAFGNGSTSTADSVVYQYATAGNYAVTLIVFVPQLGCSDTSTVNLQVSTCGLSVAIDTTIVGQSPVQIQFQSSVQGASDVYTWTFSNGATASGASTTYSYPSNGTYSVNLAVSDSSTGCAANASLTFVIEGTCGSFAPNFTYSIGIGGIVTFTDNSYDWDTAGSNGLSYLWNFGDGNTVNNSGYQVNHTYSANGTYTVSLEMLNASQGCDSVVSQTFELNRCAPAAQFNDWQNGFGSYVFVNTDYLAIADTLFNYAWTFGDGGTAFSNSPGHLYTASGNYIVTLIATSSILGCADTSKQTLAVTLCSFNDAIDTSVLSYGPEDIQFAPASNVAGYTYAWSFSDGGTATGTPVTHTYSASGSYTVNLSVSDASLGCSTTSSLTLQINNTCGLTAGFANGGNGLTQFFYTYIYDSLSATIASCSWSFPGATPSTATGLNVSGIVYPAVGTYSACAYIVSTGGCVDTVCQSVVVSAATYTISGTAGKTGGPGFAGVVYLIVQDSTGHLALLDSTVSNFDSAGVFNYYFGGLPVDTYYVKAALSTLDADYANYLPTYYGDVLNWGTATPVIISNNDASSIDISLIAGSNPGGPGFVGGYVSEGAGLVIGNTGNANAKALGDPIAGVQINLLTSTNQAVAYTFTDVNGHYQFADLALGSYKIYVEQLNKVPTPLDFTLTAENPVDSGADMNVNSHGTTGIDNTSNLQIMEVYPNPVVSSVQVQIGCKQAADATLKVVDILGRTDLEQGTKLTSGQNTAEVDMTAFAAGVYQLVIQTGSQQVTYKIVKAR